MPATARAAGSTTQPLSRAAAQIVAMPQLGPQTRGIEATSAVAPPPRRVEISEQAAGQSGRSSRRRPDAAAARRSRQNSDTIVTIVQPTCSGLADARLTRASAVARSPVADREAAGMPSDRHDETRSDAIARSRSRTAFDAGHRIGPASAVGERFAIGIDSRAGTAGFRAVDASYKGGASRSRETREHGPLLAHIPSARG